MLALAAVHVSVASDGRISVTADVMPDDVEIVLRVVSNGKPTRDDRERPYGGLELWISVPQQ